MSKTARRRDTHTAHEQGRYRPHYVRRRPHPVEAVRAPIARSDLEAMVTDHAIVNWLERVHGINVRGQFVRELLSQDRAQLALQMKTGRLRVNDTCTVLYIRDGHVVAVAVNGVDA